MAKRLDSRILEKLKTKTGNTTGSIQVGISNIRKKFPSLTLNGAAQFYADKHRTSVLQMLDLEDRDKLAQIPPQNVIDVPPKTSSVNSRKVSKELEIRTSLGKIVDPFLTSSVINDAKQMAETAYPYLYIFENSLRNFISIVMKKDFGEEWWGTQMSDRTMQDIVNETGKRMQSEKKYSFHKKRGVHPIFYTDFSHLAAIMKNKTTTFNRYFKNLPGGLNSVVIKLGEIEPSRNVTAHHNPLSKDDLHRLVGYLNDWLKQLSYIKDKGLL